MKKNSTLKGSSFVDWLGIFFQIIAPVIAVLFAILVKNQNYTVDHRLATIVAGITIQILLQGFSLKTIKDLELENKRSLQENSKKIDNVIQSVKERARKKELSEVKQKVEELARNYGFTTEMASIFSSNEQRRIQYAQRRLSELEEILYDVANSSETHLLPVSTYYQELNTLGELVSRDPEPDKCEIWAMTGFSNKEWDTDENTLEKDWCERLISLVRTIQTNRICIIDDELEALLSKDEQYYIDQKKQWEEHADAPELNVLKNLKSFIDYLSSYYSTIGTSSKVKSVFLKKVPPLQRNNATKTLIEAKGFFGIKLSDGKKYVIRGEAVDPQTGLQGQYVFAEQQVEALYGCHEYCMRSKTLEEYLLQSPRVSPGFRKFLEDNNIRLN